jgi:hypothetical protein
MNIVLKREIFKDNLTHGILFVNDKFECYTLEDTDRNLENGGVKVQNKTAIPKGTYKVTIDFSNRFQKRMMLLLKVPQFTGIRIHAGNHAGNETLLKTIKIDTLKDVLYLEEYLEVV